MLFLALYRVLKRMETDVVRKFLTSAKVFVLLLTKPWNEILQKFKRLIPKVGLLAELCLIPKGVETRRV